MMKYLSLIILLAISISCGKDAEEHFTLVTFNQTPSSRVNLNKGVMIIAKNKTLNRILGIYGSSLNQLPSQILLPNGNYHFYAYGYDGPNAVFNNTLYCDSANGGNDIGLFGNQVNVNLNLHTEACPPIFAPTTYRMAGDYIMSTSFFFCSTQITLSNYTSTVICPSSPNTFIELSILKESNLIGGGPEPVFKWCYNLTTLSTITSNKIPIGPEFKISLKAFSNSTCTTPTSGGAVIIPSLDNVVNLSGSPVDIAKNIGVGILTVYINKNIL